MKAAIITIGDEILIGQIVDSNSAYMAQCLTNSGFEVSEKVAIGDDANQIKKMIDDVFQRVDVILMTGGLGPTKDDITKKTLCEYFDTDLVFDNSVWENIQSLLSGRSSAINERTKGQAMVPRACTVIQNRVGTAPLMWFEKEGKVLVSMPGVPYEMRYAMDNEIISRLQHKFEAEKYLYKVLLVTDYAESALSIYLNDFEDNLPKGFGLAYLPSARLIKLRLSVRGNNRQDEFDKQIKKLLQLLGDTVIAEKDVSVEKLLSERLFEKGLTLSTAESCTGGNIARLITANAGASQFFKGTIVAYVNDLKIKVLHVQQESIDNYGVVSQPIVESMARGVQMLLNSNCAIAVSGIAGPGGGSDENPVGTIWISTVLDENIVSMKYQLGFYREANIMGASTLAIIQLLRMLN